MGVGSGKCVKVGTGGGRGSVCVGGPSAGCVRREARAGEGVGSSQADVREKEKGNRGRGGYKQGVGGGRGGGQEEE